jgi:hypothetical protein
MKRPVKRRDKPLSLYPLDPRMVLRRMLNTPPPPKRKAPKKRAK